MTQLQRLRALQMKCVLIMVQIQGTGPSPSFPTRLSTWVQLVFPPADVFPLLEGSGARCVSLHSHPWTCPASVPNRKAGMQPVCSPTVMRADKQRRKRGVDSHNTLFRADIVFKRGGFRGVLRPTHPPTQDESTPPAPPPPPTSYKHFRGVVEALSRG